MKKKTNNLRHQKELGEFDQVGGEYIPSLIILDKEYHIVRIVWREDKQQCLHLKFAISDQQFTSDDLFFSGLVTADWSGYERVVQHSKMSSTLKRGLEPHGSPTCLNQMW